MKSAFQRDPGDPVTCKRPHDLGHVVPSDLGEEVSWHVKLSIDVLLMVQKSGEHQLKLVVYPIIYEGFYT